MTQVQKSMGSTDLREARDGAVVWKERQRAGRSQSWETGSEASPAETASYAERGREWVGTAHQDYEPNDEGKRGTNVL